ncbi:uncharacterized protein LOC130014007 [Patella vulgata]|uniref:uncharacterized protein LOC130014007 n=1 Tax=Patella vulgata TaxID=6465 RepID=UPI0024A9B78D|nr:uncharacterized protein LOC130014007 [Patella vulgata]
MLLILLICVYSLLVTVKCECDIVTVQVSKQATLTFDLQNSSSLIEVMHNNRSILVGSKFFNNISYKVINHTEEHFSFKIVNVTRNDAGIYTEGPVGSLACIQLVVTDKPATSIQAQHQPVLKHIKENGELKGKISLTCIATSTTKRTDHNLPMIYRWFKHGIYYDNGRILQDRDVDINDKGDDIICIATYDPDCKTILRDLKQDATLTTVTTDKECKDVVGVSEVFTIQPLYGPYDIQLIYDDTNLKPGEEITKRVGEELTVNCTSDCNPACIISWYKDGKMPSSNQQLNLPDVQESDDGVYTCTVYNIHGTKNVSFTLSTNPPSIKTTTAMEITTIADNKHQTSFILDLPILTDPDCCPPAENSMSSDDVTLVDVGEKIMIVREITGYPRPSIEMESMILPVGINRHYRYINYTLINTTKPHHYNLSLSVYVVTKHYIGKYCIYLKNKYGELRVCHTLTQATNDLINTSVEITPTGIIIIICVIVPCLIIALCIIGLVIVKKCFNKMAPKTRTIPLEHHDEQFAMQQFSTDITTLNRPSNRTVVLDRESLITSSTHVSSDYERPVSIIVHRLPDYDQEENINNGVEDEGQEEDSGDNDFNDANTASLCMNSPSSVPNVYEKLNKDTRITQLRPYQQLNFNGKPRNADHTSPKCINTEPMTLPYTRLDRQTMNQRPNSYEKLNEHDEDNNK